MQLFVITLVPLNYARTGEPAPSIEFRNVEAESSGAAYEACLSSLKDRAQWMGWHAVRLK